MFQELDIVLEEGVPHCGLLTLESEVETAHDNSDYVRVDLCEILDFEEGLLYYALDDLGPLKGLTITVIQLAVKECESGIINFEPQRDGSLIICEARFRAIYFGNEDFLNPVEILSLRKQKDCTATHLLMLVENVLLIFVCN